MNYPMNASYSKQINGNLIAASAGTGKTYQLTSRFVALLALGAKPEKMIALTFTKKAAGEFRNRIFQALSDAALGKSDHDFPSRNAMAARVWETWTGLHVNADMSLSPSANPVALYPAAIPMLKRAVSQGCFPEQLTSLPGEPTVPQLSTEFFAGLLMQVLSKSSDLQLSTLDSFFNRVVAADLHRAGLSSVSPMNALQQQRATRTALLAMLAESEKSSHHESALITLLASIAEDKGCSILKLMENNVNAYLSLYKEFPEKAPWGNPAPFGLPDCSDARLITDEEIKMYQQEIDELVDSLSWKKPRSYVKKTLSTIAGKIWMGEFKSSDSFSGWFDAEDKYLAPPEEQGRDDQLRCLIKEVKLACARLFLRSVQEQSKAMHELLNKYYTAYRDCILSEGMCSFDDIKQGARQLLGQDAAGEDSGMELSLTTKLDHWMLDEFQDTDPVQWEILSNLLKENAQYPDKSLFVVGDKKQSIYSFRGASAELFEQLRGSIPAGDGYDWQKHGLTNSTLSESRRSVPEIMNFTNLVFASIDEADREFSQHSSHSGNCSKKGYVRVRILPKDKAEQTVQNTCRAIGDILDELTEPDEQNQRRLKNSISVAILVRRGNDARNIVSWLRRYKPEIPVQLVEDSPLAEASPLGELLLSFFLWLREPADKYRYNVLRSSPLSHIMQPEDKPISQSEAWDFWNHQLNSRGYAAMVQALASYLPALDSKRMIHEWLEEAVSFDAAGGSLDEWLLHMRTCCRKENGSARFVQVMTMHKSKGAEFDAVILPFLGTKAVDQPRSEGIPYFISEAQEGILVHPGTAEERQLWPEMVNYEDTWKRARRNDSYNLMYVALTRARYANYLLLPERENNKYDKESDWIQEALNQNGIAATPDTPAEFGHVDWFLQSPAKASPALIQQVNAPLGLIRKERNRISPSSLAHDAEPDKIMSSESGGNTSGADFGTRVHACFEQISWLQNPLPSWMQKDASRTTAQSVVYNALQQPEIAALFTCKPNQEVYNEQPIEAITEKNEWISGTIDRLVITVDTQGKATAAHIIDFKTNRLVSDWEESYDTLKKEYTAQMSAYRKHVADALALDPSAVSVSLLSCPLGLRAKILPYADTELKKQK